VTDDQKIEERKVMHRVRRVLLAKDPMYLAYHNVKFEEPIKADPANGILGGWAANMRLEWIVGFVRFYFKTNGKFKLVFGTFPKNAEGKNEWKVCLSLDDVEEADVLPTLWKYDDITNPVSVPGAMNSTQVKKKRPPKPKF
jgi:hypothetical protein